MARFSVSKTDKNRTAGYEISLLNCKAMTVRACFPIPCLD